MKKATNTFHDMLMEKMAKPTPETVAVFSNPTADLPPFYIPFNPAAVASVKRYASVPKKVEVPAIVTPPPITTPVKPQEKVILKSALAEEAKMKWFLFERMVGEDFQEQITRSQAMSSFRKFLKKIHPDLSLQKGEYNFATFVKIKDEFIDILEDKAA